MGERLTVVARVADALEYLQKHRVILRDLKPENVGVDFHGVVKVFDFGLARQIDKKRHEKTSKFDLSGKTGMLRYMAPEVYKCKKYGYSADVFSLAIFTYEVLSLKAAFLNLSTHTYGQRVCERGLRPSMEAAWPLRVRDLLQHMWLADPELRLIAAEVAKSLSKILKGDDQDLYPSALFSKTRWFPGRQLEDSPSNIPMADETSEATLELLKPEST